MRCPHRAARCLSEVLCSGGVTRPAAALLPCWLQDFMAEVAFNRDAIKLDNGDGTTKVVPEARLTALP